MSSTTPAPPPFDDPKNGDLIIRTRDAVDFHVHKAILSIVSPVFRDMFTLPTHSDASASDVPVVDVEEDSATWKHLLLFFYPTALPLVFDRLDIVSPLLSAATKCMMEDVLKRVSQALLTLPELAKEPVRAYAIATRHGLHDVMRAAAKSSLQRPILSYPFCSELKDITAASHHRLAEYHVACGKAAASVVLGTDASSRFCPWSRVNLVFMATSQTFNHGCPPRAPHTFSGYQPTVPQYLEKYLASVAAKLASVPSSAVPVDTAMLEPAMQSGSNCVKCAPRVYADLSALSKLIGMEVDRAVSTIKLVIDTDGESE